MAEFGGVLIGSGFGVAGRWGALGVEVGLLERTGGILRDGSGQFAFLFGLNGSCLSYGCWCWGRGGSFHFRNGEKFHFPNFGFGTGEVLLDGSEAEHFHLDGEGAVSDSGDEVGALRIGDGG